MKKIDGLREILFGWFEVNDKVKWMIPADFVDSVEEKITAFLLEKESKNDFDIKSIEVHMEMLLSDEIKQHAVIDTNRHDLPFQIFRLLCGYNEALEELDDLKTSIEEQKNKALEE